MAGPAEVQTHRADDPETRVGVDRAGGVEGRNETGVPPAGTGLIRLIRAPTGCGKTTAAAEFVARAGGACWLTDRTAGTAEAARLIEAMGGEVGRVVPLDGRTTIAMQGATPDSMVTKEVPNCLHAGLIEQWQEKGYDYRRGFCPLDCERAAAPDACPFLRSLDELEHADSIVVTKAMARRQGFFMASGNARRPTVVIDEDPVGLLRPPVEVARADLATYIPLLKAIAEKFAEERREQGLAEVRRALAIANWCWEAINRQKPGADPERFPLSQGAIFDDSCPHAGLFAHSPGLQELTAEFHSQMRGDPAGMVRNVHRDLRELVARSAGRAAYATSEGVTFHLRVAIPEDRHVYLLDATSDPEVLGPLFDGRTIEVLCDERVSPVGRVIQIMDGNYPRKSLELALDGAGEGKQPKVVRIIDAIGDLHPEGSIALISYKGHVDRLKGASRHADRIATAHFGALRGRNDLQELGCHVVVGSPKSNEQSRQQLALAVYGESILPFPPLTTVRRAYRGSWPRELSDDEVDRIWEVEVKGYDDPRMQSVYDHTVTSELMQAADRARVLIRPSTVYLVTNEPCPALWFAERCFAGDLLALDSRPRADFARNYAEFEAQARTLLASGSRISGADVCRAMGHAESWGKRYWQRFRQQNSAALDGVRKVGWKPPENG